MKHQECPSEGKNFNLKYPSPLKTHTGEDVNYNRAPLIKKVAGHVLALAAFMSARRRSNEKKGREMACAVSRPCQRLMPV
ncbi:MAG: hypothetical protein QOE46_548 [Acidobacteriota bacterium]|jgi:hypothetical protein|nr:hypothetical protein [Acidobacteriota bacterium]